jgi:Cu(I)/Ag(I) efflux system membrane fusion protein
MSASMNSKRIKYTALTLSLVAVIAALYGMYVFGKHQGQQPADMSAPMDKQSAGPKVLYWHDPMVPTQKFDKPGKSPFMDMQLVPVYADSSQGDSTPSVSISPSLQQNLGIRTAPVITGQLSNSLEVVGSVGFDERSIVVVPARAAGVIQHLSVRAMFDPVKRGQVLATVYVPDWIAAQEEYLAVRKMKGDGLEGLKSGARQRMLLAGMSETQVKLVEASGVVQAHIPITAPSSGVLSALNVREGETISMGAPLFKITALDPVWLNAEIAESASAQARVGSMVEITTASLPNQVLQGRVAQLLPNINTATRTLTGRITLANPHQSLIPGMFVQVRFVGSNHADSLLVPSEAVIVTGTRSLVFVVKSDGHFTPVDVKTGQESQGQTQILSGLSAGQQVVVSGQFLLDSEASLKGVTSRMLPAAQTDNGMNNSNNMATDMGGMKMDANMASSMSSNVNIHHGVGIVESIKPDEITISHQPIPSLQWGAMTMSFLPPKGGMPKNIHQGDHVVFAIRPCTDKAHGGSFILTTIAHAGATP